MTSLVGVLSLSDYSPFLPNMAVAEVLAQEFLVGWKHLLKWQHNHLKGPDMGVTHYMLEQNGDLGSEEIRYSGTCTPWD